MTPFLQQIAKTVASNPELSETTFIFPNQRAPLFFRQHLLEYIKKPTWTPRLISIKHFFSSLSDLHEPDRLTLIYQLYKTYKKIMTTSEPFRRFYFWGDMLLRDFDEIDKNDVDATQLFRDLSNLKELDQSFDFMPGEQKEFLNMFWKNIDNAPIQGKEAFLKIWKKLPQIYTAYTASLKEHKMGYEGLIYREVANSLAQINHTDKPFIFIGFNALAKTEEKLLCHYVERGAKVHWDTDAYYMDDPKQEAGLFLRQYRQHPILSQTFTAPPANIKNETKQIDLIGTPQCIGQARLAGQRIHTNPMAKSRPHQTAIILPDENMLLPVLHALPPTLTAINVTMGYPVQQTVLYTFLELAIELQTQQKQNAFHHRQVVALLTHAYILAHEKSNVDLICAKIKTQNKIYIPANELQLQSPLGQLLFSVIAANDAFAYLLDLIEMLGVFFANVSNFDRQCAFYCHRYLHRLFTLLHADINFSDWNEFQELFCQVMSSQKIPFTGEPLKGMQIMGLQETRNLDFENVHLLSLNENILPAPTRQNSYIPYRIRKAYQLTTHDHQGAVYAYLFYRLLQRSRHISMYYSTELDSLGGGEVSRYAKQLRYESGLPIKSWSLHNAANIAAPAPITVNKTKEIYDLLGKYCIEQSAAATPQALTPSSLNDYIDCRLRFYFKHINQMREPQQVEENPDARIFGNVLHDAIYKLYTDLMKENEGEIKPEDLKNIDEQITLSIDNAFYRQYLPSVGQKPNYQGQYLVVHAVIKAWIKKIIEHDKAYAPFTVVSLEEQFNIPFSATRQSVLLGGKIDRIDYNDKNNTLRIVDYKTGKDELAIKDIAHLFARDGQRNKAAFQTFCYAYLYCRKANKKDANIMPGLMSRENLFAPNFVFAHTIGTGRERSVIENARPYFNAFEQQLQEVIEELYDPSVPFDQTNNEQNCAYCPYQYLCHR